MRHNQNATTTKRTRRVNLIFTAEEFDAFNEFLAPMPTTKTQYIKYLIRQAMNQQRRAEQHDSVAE